MKNWLKTFWNDIGILSKGQIFHKYVLPACAIFFTWGFVGHLWLINLDKEDLVQYSGQVISIAIKRESVRNTYYPLRIGLTGYPEEFRLPSTYKKEFSMLQKEIIPGDTITLFTRNNWQTILGWGKRIDIYQIEKDGHVLFDISKVMIENKSQLILFVVLSLSLWTWYIIFRYTR